MARKRVIIYGGPAERLDRPVTDFVQPVLWCEAKASASDAARAVSAARRTCALVDLGDTVGIITDTDFRRRIATGELPLTTRLHQFAYAPVITVPDNASAATAALVMVEHDVHHSSS